MIVEEGDCKYILHRIGDLNKRIDYLGILIVADCQIRSYLLVSMLVECSRGRSSITYLLVSSKVCLLQIFYSRIVVGNSPLQIYKLISSSRLSHYIGNDRSTIYYSCSGINYGRIRVSDGICIIHPLCMVLNYPILVFGVEFIPFIIPVISIVVVSIDYCSLEVVASPSNHYFLIILV